MAARGGCFILRGKTEPPHLGRFPGRVLIVPGERMSLGRATKQMFGLSQMPRGEVAQPYTIMIYLSNARTFVSIPSA